MKKEKILVWKNWCKKSNTFGVKNAKHAVKQWCTKCKIIDVKPQNVAVKKLVKNAKFFWCNKIGVWMRAFLNY